MLYVMIALEGVLTFLSPCLLPMLPIFLAYFAGQMDDKEASVFGRLRPLGAFVVGFTLVFVALGLMINQLGTWLSGYQQIFQWVSGGILIGLGIDYLLGSPWMARFQRGSSPQGRQHWGRNVLFGATFALSWSPCVGTFLASVFALIIQMGSSWLAVRLLVTYSLGFAVPLVLTGLFFDQLGASLRWVRTHMGIIQQVAGGLLIVLGILSITGHLASWMLGMI